MDNITIVVVYLRPIDELASRPEAVKNKEEEKEKKSEDEEEEEKGRIREEEETDETLYSGVVSTSSFVKIPQKKEEQ